MSRKIIRKAINFIKPGADKVGIGQSLRQFYVEIGLLGERAQAIYRGRPKPSEAILLAGSGRSGSTWLSSLICSQGRVQEIFEPLLPQMNPQACALSNWEMERFQQGPAYISLHYIPSDNNSEEWIELFEKILTGRFRNYWTDQVKQSYFPDRYLIKAIRCNLMLGFIYRHFQPTILYLLRHPCAVIASRLGIRPPWSADVGDLLKQEALVEDYLRPWLGRIEKEKDLLGAHAVLWAVENMVALQDLAKFPHALVFYEKFLLEPVEEVHRIIKILGWELDGEKLDPIINRESRVSRKHKVYESQLSRLNSWQKSLAEEDQKRILWWAHELGVSSYSEAVLPEPNRSQ